MSILKTAIIEAAMGPVEFIGSDKAVRHYCFPSDFIGFSGHFPGYPVLPAFLQVLTALTVIEQWKGQSFQFTSMERAKFHIELRPDQEITVQCKEYEEKGKPAVEAKLLVAEGLAASLILKFEKRIESDE